MLNKRLYSGNCVYSGAVAQDGRIEPGDMILEVNGISFEDMTNDEAVQTLRSAAQQPGSVSITILCCFHCLVIYAICYI